MSSSYPPDSNLPGKPDWPARADRPPESDPIVEPNPSAEPNPYAGVFNVDHGVTTFVPPPVATGPRWWTTLAVAFLSLVVFILASAIMTVAAFVIVHGELNVAMFTSPVAMQDVLASRIGLFVMVVAPQLMLVVPPLIAAHLSPIETRRRLGLVRGNWPVWTWFAAAAATPLVGLVSSVVVGQFMTESASLKMMTEVFRNHGQTGFLIPLALMIGATPALCEELLFRGYIQTRLTKSAGPALGIVIASVLFAAFHMDFVHVIAVLPLGLFLGWISWRSASLFPAMIGHFINNVISVMAVVYAPEEQADVLAVPAIMVSLSIIGLGMIGMAVVITASVLYGRPNDEYRPPEEGRPDQSSPSISSDLA